MYSKNPKANCPCGERAVQSQKMYRQNLKANCLNGSCPYGNSELPATASEWLPLEGKLSPKVTDEVILSLFMEKFKHLIRLG